MSEEKSVVTRRGALAAVAGSATLAVPLVIPKKQAQAGTAMMGLQRPSLYRFKIGAFEVTTFLDGSLLRQGPFPMFASDQREEEVHALLKDNFLPPTRFENSYVVTLVNTSKELILFDTGNGPLRRDKGAGQLAALMSEAGYKPDDVDIIVITHGHPDHIGGMVENGSPGFPNARIIFGAHEFDYWTKGENIPDARVQTHEHFMKIAAPFGEKATFLKGGDDVVTGISAIEAFGHSPGHMTYHVESEGQQLMIWADTCNHYVVSLQRPEWHVAVDHDKEQAGQTRKKIFDMVHTDRIPVIGYHMPFPSIGFLDGRGDSYQWVAAGYQFNL